MFWAVFEETYNPDEAPDGSESGTYVTNGVKVFLEQDAACRDAHELVTKIGPTDDVRVYLIGPFEQGQDVFDLPQSHWHHVRYAKSQ